jgi:hypothetical protein
LLMFSPFSHFFNKNTLLLHIQPSLVLEFRIVKIEYRVILLSSSSNNWSIKKDSEQSLYIFVISL